MKSNYTRHETYSYLPTFPPMGGGPSISEDKMATSGDLAGPRSILGIHDPRAFT